MRRMISQKLQDFIAKLFGHIDQNGNTTEVGADLEVDGNIKVNGVENLTDKDGNPLDFGGGSAAIVDTEEIVHIEGEEGTELYLAQEVSNKVQKSLQLPVSPPLADALVGVGTNGAQKQIGIGDLLEIKNNVIGVRIIELPSKFFENGIDISITDDEINKLSSLIYAIKKTEGTISTFYRVAHQEFDTNYIYIVFGYTVPAETQYISKVEINTQTKLMSVEIYEI